MKKVLLSTLVALSMTLCSCEQMDNPTGSGNDVNSEMNWGVITNLWQVKMRRELFVPCSAYVIQLNHLDYLYMLRLRYNQDLKVDDAITYSVFSFCPDEIARINGYHLGDGSDAEKNDEPDGWGYLVASDPIEATIKSIFSMKIRYSITFLPADTWFIETTDGNLVFVKKSKVNVKLAPGDRIVYSKYTLYDEILAIKKL